jgi:3-oxoadipate enol-lactonase
MIPDCRKEKLMPPRLHHRIDGQGRRVLLMHPVGLDLTFFDAVAGDLARDHRVLRVDLRGYGGSTGLPPATSLDDYVDDVHRLLHEIDFAPAAAVGLSFGGMIAQVLAVNHPEDLDALVPCACASTFPPEGREVMRQRAVEAERGGMEAVLEATLSRWFTEGFRARGGAEPARQRLLSDEVASWAANWRAIAGLDIAPRLHEIRVPTLCIAGEADVASPPGMVAAIAERIPDARYTVMPGAPHMLFIEQPEAFAALVRGFLAETGPAR